MIAVPLTEYGRLAVRTADAIQHHMPGARSDPFAFARMCTRFRLHVEDPHKYADYVKLAAAKRKEEATAARTVASPVKAKRRRVRATTRKPPADMSASAGQRFVDAASAALDEFEALHQPHAEPAHAP